jgi:hypothetical protein
MATAQANADNAAAPLDQLLIDVGAGPLPRWLPGRPGVEFIASLAGRPRKVGRRLSIMVGELDRVALGRSAVEPKRGDRRFADPAWTHNPWLRRLVQAYLATVRFPAPVPVGSRIRGHVRLVSAEQKQAGLECAFGILVELEGSDRPACVIETVVICR